MAREAAAATAAAKQRFVVTCEHGGNRIPSKYWPLFKAHRALLDSHRGYDRGALAVAREFAAALGAELVYATTSRLLVELNRSLRHPQIFSEITRVLPAEERRRLLDRYYHPYRQWVEAQVHEAANAGERVLHLSCHSFTPRLHGEARRADVAFLYDPRRRTEAEFCKTWQRMLQADAPALRVRRNYPYRGSADGLTTYLRSRVPDPAYAGIELEVNQKYPAGDPHVWRDLRKRLIATFTSALNESRA